MKGREAIRELVAQIRQAPCSYETAVTKTEEYLRDNDFVHLDDVVEGKGMICLESKSKFTCTDLLAHETGHCTQFNCPCHNRPATIRDIIGRDK
jgi:hypothetical protein